MPIHRNAVFTGSLIAGVLLAAGIARADTVTKINGQVLKGLIVAESPADVTLQTSVGELVVRTKIARKDIADTHVDAVAENRYCRIPLHGVVGTDIRAEWLTKALQQAEGFNANVIVFDIESPGGDIAEMAKILDIFGKQHQFIMVAHVHKAMSAAAIIALACPYIVMDTHGTIGAAVPWKFGPDGLPKDVEAKFFSAFRATARSAAQFGRHDPLLAQGMMEMGLELSVMRHSDGTIEVEEGTPAGSRPLKKAGEILCLSSQDARMCGLTGEPCEDVRDLQKTLGRKDWSPVGDSVWSYMESRAALAKVDAERAQKEQTAEDEKKKLTDLLATTEAKIVTTTREKENAAKRVATLPLEYQDNLNKIDPRVTPAEHDAQTIDFRTKYESAFAEAQNTLTRADNELQDMQKLKAMITAKLREN